LQGRYDIAGAKESIAEQFETLNMEIIARSSLLPGFALVVNTKTLSKSEYDKIQEIFLSIGSAKLREIGGISRFGVIKANMKDYKALQIEKKIPKRGNFDE